jgi:outer membrane protein assembly factor BamD (BamD/ComL family)
LTRVFFPDHHPFRNNQRKYHMKFANWILASLAVAMLTLSACSKTGSVDTAPLQNSFASAEATLKSSADKAISAIKSADYSGATAELQKLASQAKLSPEQQQAIKDVVGQIQKQLADAAAKAGTSVDKASKDLQKALPKP